ncbi:MAG: TetR/AcrR family transcriptional regulator [Candidatus Binatia bacterium]
MAAKTASARAAAKLAKTSLLPTKERILAAAEEVFATRGFEGASTREIASLAGVNISSLHYHWESKERLYFAVFEHIYERMMEISRASMMLASPEVPESGRLVREEAVGRIYDFFVASPNVPRLLLRRIMENEEVGGEIERDILGPSWKVYAGWVQDLTGKKVKDIDAQILMLTMNSALLLFVLDSRQYRYILGGSVHDAKIGERVRSHLIRLSGALVSAQVRS